MRNKVNALVAGARSNPYGDCTGMRSSSSIDRYVQNRSRYPDRQYL